MPGHCRVHVSTNLLPITAVDLTVAVDYDHSLETTITNYISALYDIYTISHAVPFPSRCKRCKSDKNTPKSFSEANNMNHGTVPPALRNLTQAEEKAMAYSAEEGCSGGGIRRFLNSKSILSGGVACAQTNSLTDRLLPSIDSYAMPPTYTAVPVANLEPLAMPTSNVLGAAPRTIKYPAHTIDDSYHYPLSRVMATATVSYFDICFVRHAVKLLQLLLVLLLLLPNSKLRMRP